jgi:SPP1 gp7 family putative phage head morphogenesis protein
MISVKSPIQPKKHEREFGEFGAYMVEQIGKAFLGQVIGGIHKSTEKKFADAQAGNYASVYLGLAKSVSRKILARFDDKRIKKMVAGTLTKADKYNKQQLYAPIAEALGVDTKALIAKDGMTPQINALILESAQWANKLRDDTLEFFTAGVLRQMALGKSIDQITKEFTGEVKNRKNHAIYVARQQVSTFNSMATKIRHQKIGITRGIWITGMDGRERESHADRHEKEFDLSVGLYSSIDKKTLFPGIDHGCRCTYRALIDEFAGLNI